MTLLSQAPFFSEQAAKYRRVLDIAVSVDDKH